MRAVIQRVSHASVEVGGERVASIGNGLLVFLGVGKGDSEAQVEELWGKVRRLRIFADEQGKTNLSVQSVAGEVLVVSQFTLYADCRKGNRPSFTASMDPVRAEQLYELFLERVAADMGSVECGEFGADMQVELVNDGPFTICLDTDAL